jgi:hypothetical protein
MNIETRGLVTGPKEVLDKLPKRAFKIASWDDTRAPATQDATRDAVRALGGFIHSLFDAAHGRRYRIFVYRTLDENKACWRDYCGAE